MPTINYSVTQSIDTLAVNLSASEALVMNINNPLVGASYFGLETIPNSDGIYTSASPKNTSGSFTMGTGILGVIKDDYKMSAVVSPGNNVLTFTPASDVTGSTLRTRGIASPPISSGFTSLLDVYSGAAAAYSVRLLSSTYAGSAIRVRRSSDNTEQNIGFDSSGNLDTASLLSFCGAGNGFVTTWYDQSGNGNNATQTTAANQPQIVSSGSVILNNGKLAIQNTSTTQILYLTRTNLGTQHSFFAVIDYTSTGKEFLGDFGSGSVSWAFYQTNGEYGAQSAAGQSGVALSLNQSLFELHRNGQTGIVNYQNGSQSGSTFSITSNNDFYLSNLGGESTVYNFIGYMQEAIIYPTIQFSNRSGIASNINSFYSIY